MSFDLKIENGDLVIKNGNLRTVTDSEKLIQDLLKVALTPVGGNPAFPAYGSFVSRTLVGSALDTNIIMQLGQSQLQNSIQILKDLQKEQIKTGQIVSADEQISAILDISVNRARQEPRMFDVRIKVLSRGLKPITTAFQISTI